MQEIGFKPKSKTLIVHLEPEQETKKKRAAFEEKVRLELGKKKEDEQRELELKEPKLTRDRRHS